jgi:hypothetical protein
MADDLNDHSLLSFVDPIDDPVVSSTGAVQSFELKTKGALHPLGRLGEGSINELDGGQSHLLW